MLNLAIEDIKPDYTYIVTPSSDNWSVKMNIEVISIKKILEKLS